MIMIEEGHDKGDTMTKEWYYKGIIMIIGGCNEAVIRMQ
jgi:hypothetical protein